MSWRSGTNLFIEMWPLIKENLNDESQREAFTKKLVELFEENDIDRFDLEGVDDELDRILFS